MRFYGGSLTTRSSGRTRAAIADPDSLVFVSAVSVWEARIKQAIGKLELPPDFADVLSEQAFVELPVTTPHAHAVADLPMHHRDPFDRMLIAQAVVEALTIVTCDDAFDAYQVDVLHT